MNVYAMIKSPQSNCYLAFLAFVFFALTLSVVFSTSALGQGRTVGKDRKLGVMVGTSYYNDTSPALRDMKQIALAPIIDKEADKEGREANANPKTGIPHKDQPDGAIEDINASFLALLMPNMPSPILNFDGIPFPGVACNCAPPDTDGEVGATQYVQIVNEGYQVFNKTTGASMLGPSSIVSLWAGFGGVCQNNGNGDPIVLYDQIANRWLISQFAGSTGSGVPVTDECIAISTTSDATGTYNRYGFHLGSNFFDYPKIGVWPDGYYMSDNVFNAAGTSFLGPQAFAFDRISMLAGLPATFVSPGITGGATEDSFLPADLDGSTLPAAGTACPFVEFPGGGTYKTFLFHADFVTPANTTFTLRPAAPAAAGFTQLCGATRACIPQLGGTGANSLDGIGDRLMHRLPYRIIGGVERVVGNFTVSVGGVSGVRWFELRNVTSGSEAVFQESTYQPDATWRWMGSVAEDQSGDMAIGFSASSATINPQIRYAGRLITDPLNALPQGETTLLAGTGSQTGSSNRWGDYSAMTVDPVDDCTFWYTQEYYTSTGTFNWRTRIGSFKFPTCNATTAYLNVGTPVLPTGNGIIEPNECNALNVPVTNNGNVAATAVSATLSTSTPGVTISTATSAYPDIAALGGVQTNTTPFQISTANTVACGTSVSLTLTVTYTGGGSPAVFNFSLPVGQPAAPNYTFASSAGATIPAGGVLVSAASQADDASVAIPLPSGFSSTIYGTTVTSLSASTNGILTANGTASTAFSNIALPDNSGSPATPTLFPYWDDLNSSTANVLNGGIFTNTTGVAPNRSFIIEWRSNPFGAGSASAAPTVNFAVVLIEGSDTIRYFYVLTGTGANLNGVSATVGVQATNGGTQFTPFSFDTASLSPGLVLTGTRAPGICTPGLGTCIVTAAGVSVSGRVLTADGHGIRNAMVVLTDQVGTSRTSITGAFGYYRFQDVQAGENYVMSVSSKRFHFRSQLVSITNDLTGMDFIAGP